MATKILLKKSTTSGSAPIAGDLDVGELAINLSDRKIYAKNSGGSVVTLAGAYVDSVAPSNPSEGDIWYDTANNLLMAYNGSSFLSAGYATLSDLEDVTLTAVTTGDFLRHNGTAWVDSVIQDSDISSAMVTQHEGSITIDSTQVSDFDTEVSNNTAVTANSAKVTNVSTDLTKSSTTTNVTIHSSDGTDVAIGAATGSVAGLMTSAVFDEHTTNNAKVSDVNHNVDTNLSTTTSTTSVTVVSSDGSNAIITSASGSVAGVMTSALYNNVITNNAKSTNVTTDLGYNSSSSAGTITSSDGADATIPAATTSIAGLLTSSDKTKLNGIESGANVTDAANVTAAGALMDSELTDISAVKGINQALTTTSDVDFNNLVLAGNLTVNGTTTSVNSNEVNIGDSIIVLNADEAGTPSENGGFEVERGTSANVSFVWNETDDAWDLDNEELQNVTLDGGTY